MIQWTHTPPNQSGFATPLVMTNGITSYLYKKLYNIFCIVYNVSFHSTKVQERLLQFMSQPWLGQKTAGRRQGSWLEWGAGEETSRQSWKGQSRAKHVEGEIPGCLARPHWLHSQIPRGHEVSIWQVSGFRRDKEEFLCEFVNAIP